MFITSSHMHKSRLCELRENTNLVFIPLLIEDGRSVRGLGPLGCCKF